MEVITAMIQPFMVNKVTSALEAIKDFSGMTVSDARGLCRQRGGREQRKLRIDGFRGNVFIEIVTPDEKAQEIVAEFVRAARTSASGDGKAFVVTVDSAVRGESGEFDDRRPDALLTLLIFASGASNDQAKARLTSVFLFCIGQFRIRSIAD